MDCQYCNGQEVFWVEESTEPAHKTLMSGKIVGIRLASGQYSYLVASLQGGQTEIPEQNIIETFDGGLTVLQQE
jgi:hypothetical protein